MASKKAAKALVVAKEEQDFARIRAIESALHERAASILGYAMMAPDLDETEMAQDTPSGQWLSKFDNREEGQRAWRIARAAWSSAKEAPVFLKLAPAFLAGSMKARANENAGPRVMNATIVTMTTPMPQFPERLVDK